VTRNVTALNPDGTTGADDEADEAAGPDVADPDGADPPDVATVPVTGGVVIAGAALSPDEHPAATTATTASRSPTRRR